MLTAEGLTKSFRTGGLLRSGERLVLNRVDLHLESGELVALAGRNGAGKTTLVRIMAGLMQPDDGSLRIGDADLTARPLERRRRVRLVAAESRSFYWRLTCRQNLDFFARLLEPHLEPGARRRRVGEVLEAMELTERADDRFMHLSTGLMQRMTLARGLLGVRDFLLLDEPARELDPPTRARLVSRVRELAPAGVLWVTHRPEDLAGLASRFLVLDGEGLRQADDFGAALELLVKTGEGE